MSLTVYLRALRDAAAQWEDRAEELHGAHASLTSADTDLLGPRVGPVAAAFVDAWAAEVRRLAAGAGDHAEALRDNASIFSATDLDTVQRMQDLLPWADRHATPAATP